jgi:GDP-4-dehydro-6-deoxy-D-mannose reductase
MTAPILVTGAGGFVGRHLVSQLGPPAVPAAVDVTDAESVSSAVRANRPAAVVHLAARSSVAASWTSSVDVWRVNVLGTVNLLDAVRAEAAEARMLVVSTGEVYGETTDGPASEDHELAPLSPYAASKAAAEIACSVAQRVDGLDVLVTRSFLHAGPGQSERFAIGSWTAQIARLERAGGGTLLVGDLSVERDILDVRDVCRGYRLLLDPAVPADFYNVASGTTVPLSRVVELLVGMARCRVDVRQDPARARRVDVRVLCGDPSRLSSATGWRPEIPLEKTLADALEHARNVVAEGATTPVSSAEDER